MLEISLSVAAAAAAHYKLFFLSLSHSIFYGFILFLIQSFIFTISHSYQQCDLLTWWFWLSILLSVYLHQFCSRFLRFHWCHNFGSWSHLCLSYLFKRCDLFFVTIWFSLGETFLEQALASKFGPFFVGGEFLYGLTVGKDIFLSSL